MIIRASRSHFHSLWILYLDAVKALVWDAGPACETTFRVIDKSPSRVSKVAILTKLTSTLIRGRDRPIVAEAVPTMHSIRYAELPSDRSENSRTRVLLGRLQET